MKRPDYSETIAAHGVVVPVVEPVINERMRGVIESGRYERNEVGLLQNVARPDDNVLELGGGVGVVSVVAARAVGAANVTSVEANPELIPIIRETHRLNEVEDIDLVHGVGFPNPRQTADHSFFLRKNFWASSMERRRQDRHSDDVREAKVPVIALNELINTKRPTILVMDIEGGELALSEELDLSTFRVVIMELHPRVYGEQGVARVFDRLAKAGFAYDAKASRGGTVVVFNRYRTAVPLHPRVCAVTCMKDEAPFILEWVSFHRAIGMTDFLIFTNDCSDGTIELLDALDERGIVRHLPNPSSVLKSPHHQPIAVQYAKQHKEARDADWVISMDVDEFVNIHIGNGMLSDMFDRLPEAEAISLTHLDFGCDGIEIYEDRFIIEQMSRCAIKSPTERDRRGIKTFVHRDAPSNRLSNHRPFFDDPANARPIWLDGSGRPIARKVVEGEHKGIDCRESYELAQLNHYPVRSMESFLVKSVKGDVVAKDKFVDADYFAKRDAANESDTTISQHAERAKQVFQEFLQDAELRRLHRRAVRRHRKAIAKLRAQSDKQDLLDLMRARYSTSGFAE